MAGNDQLELLTPNLPVIARLDATRGVVDAARYPEYSFDPEARMNIVMLAGHIGVALSEQPRQENLADPALSISRDDFMRSKLDHLKDGLIIVPEHPLYRHPDNRRVAINWGMPVTIFGEQGVQKPDIGVALGVNEYQHIAIYPRPLADRARTTTLDALAGQMDREAANAAAMRAAGHALEGKIDKIEGHDKRFLGEIALLKSLHNDARIVWRTAYLGKNLDRKRREGDELIHSFVEIAANNLGFTTPETNATHRVFASNLYRRGSAENLAQSWRVITDWAIHYLGAKRGKANQALNGARMALFAYKPYLDAEQERRATLAAAAEASQV